MRVRGQWGRGGEGGDLDDDSVIVVTSSSRLPEVGEEKEEGGRGDEDERVGTTASSSSSRRRVFPRGVRTRKKRVREGGRGREGRDDSVIVVAPSRGR